MADANALVNALALSGSADPSDLIRNQLQAQQQQALAQALMQQGLAPMSGTQSVGGVAIRTSPMEGAAKLAALLSGQSLQGQANDKSVQAMLAQSQALRGMFADQPPAQSNAQAALAAGAQQGSVGPTNSNARVMSQLPPQQGTPSPYALAGLTPQANMTSFMTDPGQHMKELAEAGAATPEMKNNRAMGYTPQMALAAKLAADAKAGEIERRGGNQYKNFLTGENGMVPKIPDYANPVGGIAANGALLGGVSPMPGAVPIAAGTAARIEAAREGEKILPKVERPNGGSGPMRAGDAAGLGGTAPVVGQTPGDATIQKVASETISAAPQIALQSKSAITGLETALSQVEAGIKSGAGTGKAMNVAALLNNMGIPLLKGDVEGYQTMQKYLQNSLNASAAGTTAGGSDARFESFMKGQPNAETMTGKPLASAIRYVLSQHDAAIARADALPQAYASFQKVNDPNAALAAQELVNKSIKSDFFAFNRMDPAEQATYLRHKGADAKDFVAKYNKYAETTGWVK